MSLHTRVHMHWLACKCPPPITSAGSDCACLPAESLDLHVPLTSEIQLIWNQTPLKNVTCSFLLEGMTVASFHLSLHWGPVAPTCAPQLSGSLPLSQGLPPPALGKSLDQSSHLPPAYYHSSFSPGPGLLCFAEVPCAAHMVHTPAFSSPHCDCPSFPECPTILCPRSADFSLVLSALKPLVLVSSNNFHFFSVQFCF